MNDKQDVMWDALCELSGEQVLRLFTDYLGLQVLDDGFYEHLQDEGFLPDDEIEDEDDEIRKCLQVDETDDFEEFCESWETCTDCPVRNSTNSIEHLSELLFCKYKFQELREEAESDG